jgi:hypothetical protein
LNRGDRVAVLTPNCCRFATLLCIDKHGASIMLDGNAQPRAIRECDARALRKLKDQRANPRHVAVLALYEPDRRDEAKAPESFEPLRRAGQRYRPAAGPALPP